MKKWILIFLLCASVQPVYGAGLDAIVKQASQQTGVPEQIIQAVIRQESNWNKRAVSHKGAQGLMQLMPATARRFGVKNVFDPSQNIMAGSRYLAWLYRRYESWPLALAGYNAGEGKVDRYGGIPPYRETREYVKKIMADLKARQTPRQPVALAHAAVTPVPKSDNVAVVPKQQASKSGTLLPQNASDDQLMLLHAALGAPTTVQWEPPAGYYD